MAADEIHFMTKSQCLLNKTMKSYTQNANLVSIGNRNVLLIFTRFYQINILIRFQSDANAKKTMSICVTLHQYLGYTKLKKSSCV